MVYDLKTLHTFLDGNPEEHFKHYVNWNDGSEFVPLSRLKPHRCPEHQQHGKCTCRAEWVVVKATTNRQGVVAWSNTTLTPRTVVGIRTSWMHVQQVLGTPADTIGSPGMLKIVSTPKATPARKRHAPPARVRRAA